MEHISDITMFILGKKNVGKTTLLNKYIENNENSNFKIENDEKYIEKVIRFKDMIKNIKIELIENNDFTFYNSLTKKIICFILIYSITDKNSFIQCREWIKKIKENYNLKNNKILLFGNKNDDKENRKVLFDEGDIFAIKNNLLFFECSCFNDYFNIENSINLLLTQIIEFNFENLSYIPLNPKSPIIINIIGDKSTGKSFIINNIPNKIIVDIGENSYIIITKFIKTQFENNKNKNIFYSSNGILFIYSYNDKNSFINLETFIENNENFKNHISFMPVIILGNNINDEKKEITFEEGKKLSEERLWKFIEISNKNNILKPIIKILKLIILSKNVTLNRSEQKLINDNLIINIKIPKKINKNTLNKYFGKAIFKKEGRYKGFFYNYQRNGKGYMDYTNKNKYIGNWKNNEKNGYGIMEYHLIGKYKGYYKNDKRNGKGKFEYLNGDIYEGNWENDMKNGKGKMEYITKKEKEFNLELYSNPLNQNNNQNILKNEKKEITLIYNGNWKNDLWDGKGEIYCKNNIYEGIFLEGNMLNFGKIYYNNGDKYIGYINNLIKEGNGIMNYKNGSQYNGNWENDIKNGNGIMIFNNGNLFNGLWKDDKMNKGIFYSDKNDYKKNYNEQTIYLDFINKKLIVHGKILCGEFIDDKLNGDGYEINKEYFFIGKFKSNKKNGKGTLYYLKGNVINGEWIDDKISAFKVSKIPPAKKKLSIKMKKKIEKSTIR